MNILVLNCGSSSVKYELRDADTEKCLAKGIVERVGMHDAILRHYPTGKEMVKKVLDVPDHAKAIALALQELLAPEVGVIKDKSEIGAVGHRVVHGGEKFAQSVLINKEVKDDIREMIELAPLHNPHNLKGIKACEDLLPGIPQVAVFDTSFHQTMPPYAYIYALPYAEYQKYGIRRYGFHGTSHRYVAARAAEMLGTSTKKLKIITCHLGNGCSITAVKNGVSVDTSMGYTPLEGLVMGTRCGDLDPAIVIHFMAKTGATPTAVDTLLNKHSGLDGISGISNDMRQILQKMEAGDEKAKLAFEIFCYRLKKYIGSYAAAMEGVDVLVFTAGIGENAWKVREKTCAGLEWMGVKLNLSRNQEAIGKEAEISEGNSQVKVFVIPTKEELLIARDTKKNYLRSEKLR